MTRATLHEANLIAEKIEKLKALEQMTNLCHCTHDLIVECDLGDGSSCRGPIRIQDKGLREVINTYCHKRIEDLNEELDHL